MSITIIRKVDDLGRVVIPKDARRQLGIEEGDELEVAVRENEIVLRPVNGSGDKAIVEAAREFEQKAAAYAQHLLNEHDHTLGTDYFCHCDTGVELLNDKREAELRLRRLVEVSR